MNKKFIISAFLLAYSLFPVNNAHAVTAFCTNCSDRFMQAMDRVTNVEQLKSLYAEYAESIQQTASQIQMVQQNVEQYTNMVRNTVAIPKNMIAKISKELTRFAQITNSVNTMRADIMGLENVFDTLYQAQEDFGKLANMPREMASGRNMTIRANLDVMSKRVDEATQATFQVSGAQLKDLEMSGETESYINELLNTPEGRMEALQSGNQLAAMQIQEARQLRELIATSLQSDLASQIKDEKQEQLSEEISRRITDMSDLKNQKLIEELPLF